MRLWRVGILSGTGTALKRTIPALLDSEMCQVTVVHGRNGDRLKAVAELDSEIRLTTSEREFGGLRDHYDVVFIGSPPFLHLRHLELAAELDVPVICEKPLIAYRDELPRLLGLVEGSRMPLAVAHHIRHQQAVTDILELLGSGRLGRPVAARLQWCFMMNHQAPNARWKLDPRLGGSSAMFDCGVHAIDLAVLLFGAPGRVSAIARRLRTQHVFDSVTARLDYPGFAVEIVASQSAANAGNDLRITFEGCTLLVGDLFGEKAVREVEIVGGREARTVQYEPQNLYRLEVEDFCRSLEGSEAVGTGVADALTATRILFALEEAFQTRQVVDL